MSDIKLAKKEMYTVVHRLVNEANKVAFAYAKAEAAYNSDYDISPDVYSLGMLLATLEEYIHKMQPKDAPPTKSHLRLVN